MNTDAEREAFILGEDYFYLKWRRSNLPMNVYIDQFRENIDMDMKTLKEERERTQ